MINVDEINNKLKNHVKKQRMRLFFSFSPRYVNFLQQVKIIEKMDKSTSKEFEDWDMYLQYKGKEYVFCFRECEGFTDDSNLLEEDEMYHFWELLHDVEHKKG